MDSSHKGPVIQKTSSYDDIIAPVKTTKKWRSVVWNKFDVCEKYYVIMYT